MAERNAVEQGTYEILQHERSRSLGHTALVGGIHTDGARHDRNVDELARHGHRIPSQNPHAPESIR